MVEFPSSLKGAPLREAKEPLLGDTSVGLFPSIASTMFLAGEGIPANSIKPKTVKLMNISFRQPYRVEQSPFLAPIKSRYYVSRGGVLSALCQFCTSQVAEAALVQPPNTDATEIEDKRITQSDVLKSAQRGGTSNLSVSLAISAAKTNAQKLTLRQDIFWHSRRFLRPMRKR
jgi:hypothetical protein